MTYTQQSTLGLAQTAYDLMAYFALRPELYLDAVADVEPSNQAMVGSTVSFYLQNDLAIASTPLTETSDVTAVALSAATPVTITLQEYGNVAISTALGRATSYLDLDRLVTNVVGFNAGISLDTLAKNVLAAGTNVNYAAGNGSNVATARNQVTPANTLTANDIRNARATLTRNNVQRINGYYISLIHPDVTYDLMGQTGAATWNEPHAYNQPGEIWAGELGSFQTFRFIETPRAPIFADAGSSTTDTDVYRTLCLGKQALAKAYSYVDGNGPYPTVVPGPITDKLRRFVPWGWFWLGNYGVFRQQALLGIEGASSIGQNSIAGSH